MDCVGRFVSCVSFRSLVGQLRLVRLLPLSSLVSRFDYRSGATVTSDRDDYENEEDVRDRDTRDRDYNPYETDCVRRFAEVTRRRPDSRFDNDRISGEEERDDRYRGDDYYRCLPSGGVVSR